MRVAVALKLLDAIGGRFVSYDLEIKRGTIK